MIKLKYLCIREGDYGCPHIIDEFENKEGLFKFYSRLDRYDRASILYLTEFRPFKIKEVAVEVVKEWKIDYN